MPKSIFSLRKKLLLCFFLSIQAGFSFAVVEEGYCFSKDSIFYVLEAEGLGGYSQIEGEDGIGSTADSWLASPTLKLNDRAYWINIYNGSYNHSAQVIAQDEGNQTANTTQTHNLSSVLRYAVTNNWFLRPLFFVNWIFVNETKDEKFGEGLYDYRDIGGGLESSWILNKSQENETECGLGFRYLNREYPNYLSLLALFDPNGSIETNEKDLNGYKINLSYDNRSQKDATWGVEGIFFYKDYVDKKTIDSDGVRTSDTREDFLQNLNLYWQHPLQSGWILRLDGQFALNLSNLDFYDTHLTTTFTDDDFLENYFDYFSFLVKPSLIYTQNWDKEKTFSLSLSYSFEALHYTGRKAQDVLGNYGPEDQEDLTHAFDARTSFPLTKNFSWISSFSYTIADSNQQFESSYLYNYSQWSALTGVSFKY